MRTRNYFIYILPSDAGILYTVMTNDLKRSVFQHRTADGESFTRRYRVYKLVWWELAREPRAAIAREKEIKAWSRRKRVALIEADNPGWQDLAADWYR